MSEPVVSVADVLQIVAAHYAYSVTALKSHRRHPTLNRARHIAYWVAREITTRSTPEIGRAIGDRDHSTVIHGIRWVEQQLAQHAELRDDLEGLKAAAIAVAQLRQRRVIGPLREIDPIAVAIRVAQGGARDAGRVSIDEIRAVCEALTDERHALLEARSLIAAAKEAAAALREQRQARFTIREPSADVRVRNALEALSHQVETQEQADG